MPKLFDVDLDLWILFLVYGGLFGISAIEFYEVFPTTSYLSLSILLWITLVFCCWYFSFTCSRKFIKQANEDFLDIPNKRSSHRKPTPRGGGKFFFLGFLLGNILLKYIWSASLISSGLGRDLFTIQLLILYCVSIQDDQGHVSARLRYLVHFLVAILAFSFGRVPLPIFGQSPDVIHILGVLLTFLFITGFINLYNFMDGLDGLVAGTVLVQTVFLALYLHQPALIPLAAGLVGFLRWNWSPAKVFMGDVGSTTLGAIIILALINGSGMNTDWGTTPELFWSAIAITFPLIGDATYTIFRRLLRQENIFKAHRFHIYQRLHQSGWTHRQVALTYIAVTGIIAVLIYQWDLAGSAIAALLTLAGILSAELYLQNKGKLTPPSKSDA
ncbi:MAG: glycosyltransferase family 4 protein [Spirulina sp. SIO3F2]|nr:glycosyltransferase family 4 protein [Spirulina sp. SIO3F2]